MALYRVNKPRHPQAQFHVKKNDEVVVLSGTQQGKRGKVLEVLRFGCEMTCAASAVHHLSPSMPCSAKRWTGERYECSLVAQLKLEDRIAFAEKLLFEWRMAVRSNSTSSRAATD